MLHGRPDAERTPVHTSQCEPFSLGGERPRLETSQAMLRCALNDGLLCGVPASVTNFLLPITQQVIAVHHTCQRGKNTESRGMRVRRAQWKEDMRQLRRQYLLDHLAKQDVSKRGIQLLRTAQRELADEKRKHDTQDKQTRQKAQDLFAAERGAEVARTKLEKSRRAALRNELWQQYIEARNAELLGESSKWIARQDFLERLGVALDNPVRFGAAASKEPAGLS